MWFIFIIIVSFVIYLWLFWKLLHLTTKKIRSFSRQYLILEVSLMLSWIVEMILIVGRSTRIIGFYHFNFYLVSFGLLTFITGIIILVDSFKREKIVLKREHDYSSFEAKLNDFRKSRYGVNGIIASYENLGFQFLFFGLWFLDLSLLLPLNIAFTQIIISLLIATIIWTISYHYYHTLIWRWALDKKILAIEDVPRTKYM